MFAVASNLFVEKWNAVSNRLATYFEDVYLNENRNWYEGFLHRTPSTNNALESFNNVIKREQTLRERFDLGQFRTVLFDMTKQWSIEYKSGLNELNLGSPNIQMKLWTSGYQFARSDVAVKGSRRSGKVIYSIPVSRDNSCPTDMELWENFEDFKKNGFAIAKTTYVYPVTSENWILGECDCSNFFKLFVCEHLIGIALRLKVIQAPAEAKTIPIGMKRKRGRPKKARPALVVQ